MKHPEATLVDEDSANSGTLYMAMELSQKQEQNIFYVLELEKERAPAGKEAQVVEAQQPEPLQPAVPKRLPQAPAERRSVAGRER